jgi:uncharacterized protein YutE (UPF0331/DUF86 family)
MDELLKIKLLAAINECLAHLERMNYAYGNISLFLPTSAEQLAKLTNEQVEALDQYIHRYTKLQDAMGRRLFKHLLASLAEDIRSMAFIDWLNRLEQLGVIPSAQEWLELRQLRNQLAHEYEDNSKEQAEIINLVFEKHPRMIVIFQQVKHYIEALEK